MKIVINRCFGGFSLSPKAVKRLAELNGKECYFFKHDYKNERYDPITMEDAGTGFMWTAFTIPNPNELIGSSIRDENGLYNSHNERYAKYDLDSRPDTRHDALLVQVVEELGDEANGRCALLAVVEIPDGTEYEIDEYDGRESIHEVHKSWG